MNAYDETAFRYEIDVDKWRDSSSPEEKEYLQSRASELWSELDEIKTERNVALIILGSVWGLGLLDTFFPLDEFVPSAGGLSVQAGPTGMTIALDF
ncbi:MAG TPA: hypothetical protein VLA34_02105, partial [Candidatus Krumholzibacterium sp.]|nr:hypothetical protein [Candidatus Krumholzibacterium sp.]